MIIEKRGNLLESTEGFIAHQVNCKGVMGAGVAKQIKNKILKDNFQMYKIFCNEHSSDFLLGQVQCIPFADDPTRYVVNLFGENVPTGKGLDTNYDALKHALSDLYFIAKANHANVAIPAYLGCGLAGGDWNHVYTDLIYSIFGNCDDVILYIYYLDEAVELLKQEFIHWSATTDKTYIHMAWHGFPKGTAKDYIRDWLVLNFS